jgi:sirohydrochlorin cobaltochelatase
VTVPAPRRPALLVIGHGTKSAQGCAEFAELVERVQLQAPFADVAGGFLELAPPPIQDAVTRLVEAGHTSIDVVPLVLVAAGHSKGDIPAALARERGRHPGLSFRYGRPLGSAPELLAVAEARVEALVPRPDWPGTAVVLVGRGATDPDANAEIAKTAPAAAGGSRARHGRDGLRVAGEPSVPAGLARALRLASAGSSCCLVSCSPGCCRPDPSAGPDVGRRAHRTSTSAPPT